MVKFKVEDANFNKIYPVGSIYMSINETNPTELFGGEWEQIEDRFLLACGTTYSNGSTGGEEKHTLTINEMPSHTHIQNAHHHELNRPFSSGTGSNGAYVQSANRSVVNINSKDTTATNQNTGGGQPHNNMPPYLAVYCWVRIA